MTAEVKYIYIYIVSIAKWHNKYDNLFDFIHFSVLIQFIVLLGLDLCNRIVRYLNTILISSTYIAKVKSKRSNRAIQIDRHFIYRDR